MSQGYGLSAAEPVVIGVAMLSGCTLPTAVDREVRAADQASLGALDPNDVQPSAKTQQRANNVSVVFPLQHGAGMEALVRAADRGIEGRPLANADILQDALIARVERA